MRVPLLAFLVFFLIRSLVAAVEKPFNFNETPGKLPKEVVPTEYAIHIVPNLDNFTFAGSESVKLNVKRPVHQLVLNGLELKIEAASVDGKELPLSAIKTDNVQELLTLTLPSELEVGDHALTLRFTGKINQQGQGLFYMRYQEQGSNARKVMLGTQFEATDARRFFRCALSIAEAGSNCYSRRLRWCDGKLGRNYLLRIGASVRPAEFLCRNE